jgi:hypothetical protein
MLRNHLIYVHSLHDRQWFLRPRSFDEKTPSKALSNKSRPAKLPVEEPKMKLVLMPQSTSRSHLRVNRRAIVRNQVLSDSVGPASLDFKMYLNNLKYLLVCNFHKCSEGVFISLVNALVDTAARRHQIFYQPARSGLDLDSDRCLEQD